jgi:hypothetical protein
MKPIKILILIIVLVIIVSVIKADLVSNKLFAIDQEKINNRLTELNITDEQAYVDKLVVEDLDKVDYNNYYLLIEQQFKKCIKNTTNLIACHHALDALDLK